MLIHEYQAKELFTQYGICVPKGTLFTEEDHDFLGQVRTGAEKLKEETGASVWVVKAQVHAGGRGKAGGVKLCRSLDEVENASKDILGKTLITAQTGAKGKKVHKIWIEEGTAIARELYVALLLDRAKERIVLMGSTEGGMEIEKVATQSPEKIFKIPIDLLTGYQAFHGLLLGKKLGLKGTLLKEAVSIFGKLYKLFIEKDAALVEINPLVVTEDEKLIALDAKVNFENNGLFRHKDIQALHDPLEENPQDLEAARYGLAYIALDGSIGCMVNGAGLAMATMDIIKLYGSEPANFLDVGGGASREKVTAAFRIILQDPKVRGVLVNIFGGIMRCDVIAQGILEATENAKLQVPLVVRLAGTKMEEGLSLLKNSSLSIVTAQTLSEAAQKIVELAK